MNQSRIMVSIFLITFWGLLGGCTGKSSTQPPVQKAQPALTSQITDSGLTAISLTIKMIVADQLRLDLNEIQVDVPLSKQKKPADDLDVMQIILTIQEKYKVELKDEEIGITP